MKRNIYPFLACAFLMIAVQSCSKKTHPTQSAPAVHTETRSDTLLVSEKIDSGVAIKADTIATVKPATKTKPKESVPKVIVVNDKYAKKSVDGRYYYDLQGHRYWRSNKDGKYYLFNKSMLTDDAFKKPD
jgi:hypothetical protein